MIFFPKKPVLKNFPIFSQKSPKFSANGNPPKRLLISQKSGTLKKYLIFQEMELSGLSPQNFSLKKFLIFFPKKSLWKNFLYFWKWNFAFFSPSSNNKKIHSGKISHISGNGNTKKKSYISLKGKLFLCFMKQRPQKISYISENFLYFRK